MLQSRRDLRPGSRRSLDCIRAERRVGPLVRLAEQHHPNFSPGEPSSNDLLRPAEACEVEDKHVVPGSLPAELLDELDRQVEASLRDLPDSTRNRLTRSDESRNRLLGRFGFEGGMTGR
jgi:hypothetical protein